MAAASLDPPPFLRGRHLCAGPMQQKATLTSPFFTPNAKAADSVGATDPRSGEAATLRTPPVASDHKVDPAEGWPRRPEDVVGRVEVQPSGMGSRWKISSVNLPKRWGPLLGANRAGVGFARCERAPHETHGQRHLECLCRRAKFSM